MEDLVALSKPRPRFSRTGRVFTPPKYQDYESHIGLSYRGRFFGEEFIKVSITFEFKVPKSYSKKKRSEALEGILRPTSKDTDNLVKGVTDALNGIAWKDDRYIYVLQAEKKYSEVNRITIIIESMEGQRWKI